MLKVGDKVKVIEENLKYENIGQQRLIKEFIAKNEDNFVVTGVWENDKFPIVISKQNGEKMAFLEKELTKVEE